MKTMIKKWLRNQGLQISKYPDEELERRLIMLKNYNIDTILDVGANIGQYALKMRDHGYQKKIISFEPLKSAFETLKAVSVKDKNWSINNFALGDSDSGSLINIAENSFSSSILNMLPEHLVSAPESKYIAQQEIEIKQLDSIYDRLCSPGSNVMLKIDTQGYEKNVIDGARESLTKIKILQLEMSLIPLYEHELLYMDMILYLDQRGFQLYSLEPGHFDQKTGQLLQVDGVFVQKK